MLLFSRSFTLKKVLDLCLLVFFNFFFLEMNRVPP